MRRDELATAFVSPRWWPRNHDHVMVVPNSHYENLYDLPSRDGHAIHELAREVAIAIRRTCGCDGTSLRQHNPLAKKIGAWPSVLAVSAATAAASYAAVDRRAQS
ncbi:hypothetical protein [Actinoplanes sp. NPDC089786]|uniref:HIT family protein n=1 Tax=Actinoplanes sp. NPDC089786 TaxID=3155185 RepID=UPI003418FAF3